MMIKWELTDTFGGEANYSWVRRGEIELPDNATDRQIMHAVKREAQLSGIKGRTFNYGDFIEFRPYGMLQVLFINFVF